MERRLVIFDLDGTLVDSETLGNQAFLDLLPDLADTVEHLTDRYRGMKLRLILDDLAQRLGRELPDGFEASYRSRVSVLFNESLKPIAGASEMLAAVRHSKCVASSGPLAKIQQSLSICGLANFFGDKVFSSYVIQSWKPDPGLFLHAASSMGFDPAECVVVEDSEVGIDAAIAAGMTAIHFTPRPAAASRAGVVAFGSMAELPGLIGD